jgi:hypothetical protein
MALVKGKLEGAVMRVTEEMVELPGEGGSLDFFLGEVSAIAGDTEREYGSARCNRNSGGNGGCGKDFAGHEVTWEDPSVVGLDGAGAEGGTCRTSDDKRSIAVSANRVARCCECA